MVGSISCVLHSFGIIINRFLFNIPLQAKIPIEWDFKGVKKSRKFKGFKSVKLCNFDPFPDINLDFENFCDFGKLKYPCHHFQRIHSALILHKELCSCMSHNFSLRYFVNKHGQPVLATKPSSKTKPRECRTIALKSNLINHKFYIKGFSSAHFVARIWNFIWVENPKNCLI